MPPKIPRILIDPEKKRRKKVCFEMTSKIPANGKYPPKKPLATPPKKKKKKKKKKCKNVKLKIFKPEKIVLACIAGKIQSTPPPFHPPTSTTQIRSFRSKIRVNPCPAEPGYILRLQTV